MVWEETFQAISDLDETWKGLDVIPIGNVVELTFGVHVFHCIL
jgi:hypothetical protein